MGSVSHPSHATNVLKLLMGEKRDALEVRPCSFVYVKDYSHLYVCIHESLGIEILA